MSAGGHILCLELLVIFIYLLKICIHCTATLICTLVDAEVIYDRKVTITYKNPSCTENSRLVIGPHVFRG